MKILDQVFKRIEQVTFKSPIPFFFILFLKNDKKSSFFTQRLRYIIDITNNLLDTTECCSKMIQPLLFMHKEI